jgi:6-methylsalicylate decarboxylase
MKRTEPLVPTDRSLPSRRGVLSGFASLSAGALLLQKMSSAQSKSGPRRIDFHHHFQSPEVMAFAAQKGIAAGNVQWTLAKDLDDMDKSGTATAMMSAMGQPGQLDFGDAESSRKAVRLCNDFAAKLRADHPTRFGIFGMLPWWYPDNDNALKEVEYVMDTLKADGFASYTSHGDRWFGDPSWNPIYQELNRRKAVVFVHPHTAKCCENISVAKNIPNEGAMIEYGIDTTRAIANVVFTGFTQRFPDITLVFSHAGGMMPFIIERFFQGGLFAEVVPGIVTKGQDGGPIKNVPTGNDILRELRKLYYDTAQSSNPVAMGALRKVVPVSQIVYGTDFWYRTSMETSRGLMTNKVFNAKEQYAIGRGNAERILPKYKS